MSDLASGLVNFLSWGGGADRKFPELCSPRVPKQNYISSQLGQLSPPSSDDGEAFYSFSSSWEGCCQGVTKRCRLSWLTNCTLVYEPKCWGRGGGELRGLTLSHVLNAALHRSPNKLWRSNSIFNYGCCNLLPSCHRRCFHFAPEGPGFVPNTSLYGEETHFPKGDCMGWAVGMGGKKFFPLPLVPSLDFSICFAVKQRAWELLLYAWKKARCPD